ncbi:MAG: hypothetical protein DRP51_08035 [Candidatus Zixiibacteriota bacterium]|nr:MAG: hypothetical protein DRP51_08035 [candidate division Zixibacteria bacterium]
MRTVIIGGGKGCRAIIDLALGSFLKELPLDIICVVDIDPDARGISYAREKGIKTSTDMYQTILKTENVELIIELTGDDNVLREIQGILKPGTRLFDHTFAHIFWDLVNAREERKRQLRELEAAERRFKSFIDSADDWISIKDNKGRYVIVNPVVANAFHRKVEDFIGKTVDEVLPPDLAKTIKMHDQQVIETKRHLAWDEVVLIDGVEHHFQAKRFPLTNHKGEITGTCTIMRDVSSEKELRDQLVQAVKLAAVGQLAAGVAHEINNPLTGILAFAEDIKDDLSNDDPHFEDIKVIIRETLRCRDIVRNLLDFARQEAPKLENVNPNDVIDQALSLIERLPQFRNIRIQKNTKADIPHIQGDPQQIQQVILNLMLNAVEAMDGKGSIVLTTEYDRRHNRCAIAVEDDGPGIPENLIDKVFEPFFSTKGTNGLGLAISWGIVERHHGTIEIDMADSGGAIFRVLLPATYLKKEWQ